MRSRLSSVLSRRLPAGGAGRQISWVMVQSGVETGLMTVAVFLTARWFGDVLLGRLGVLLAGVQLITMMADGLYVGIVREVSQRRSTDPANAAAVGWKLGWLTILVTGVFAGLAMLTCSFVDSSVTVPLWLFLAGLIAVFRVARTSFESAFRALGQFRWPCIVGSITIGSGAIVIIVLAAMGYRVGMYLAVQAGALAANALLLGLLYFHSLTRAHDDHAFADVAQEARALTFFKYTAPLVLRGVVGFLYLKVNIWLIWGMASDAEAGQFRLVDQVLTVPRLVMSAVLAAFAPKIVPALQNMLRLGQITAKFQGILVLISIPFALIFVFSPWVLLPLFPQFELACQMLQVYAPVIPLMGLAFTGTVLLVHAGHPTAALQLSIWSSIANVIGAYLGLKLIGVFGSVVVMSLVHATSSIVMLFVTYKLLNIRFNITFK